MKRDDSSPKAYRESVPQDQREILESIRETILDSALQPEEGIEYGMLSYEGVGHLAAQKQYVSFYINPEVLDEFRHRLPANCGKSCIRYRNASQLDLEVLEEIMHAISDQGEKK